MKKPEMLNDVIFKIVFGRENSEALLRLLLNALLSLDGDESISELTILNPQLDKSFLTDKGVILDVAARDHAGRMYNIEVQMTHQAHFVKRSLYYLARLFTQQMESGDAYGNLTRTIAISILDYTLFPDQDDLHSTFRFHDAAHGRDLSDVLEIHYIELVKFKKDAPAALRTPFERWLHVLKYGELYERDLEMLPQVLKAEEGVEMAIDKMREARSSAEVREMIEIREKALHDEAWRIASHLEKAHQQGLEQGLEQGVKQGLEQVARRMLAAGMDPETIEKLTGLHPGDLTRP